MASTSDEDYIAYVTGRLPVLRRIASQLAGDPHRGDDLVQQAITRLYTHWRRASAAGNLDAYVYKILVRALLDERRLRWSAIQLAGETAPEDVDQHDPTAAVAEQVLLRDALRTLPPRQRAVLVLRFLADRPVDEVADILQIAPGTVKSQTHDGLAALRRLLGADDLSASTTFKE